MGPYKKDKKPTVRPSFCLFIDALGFKDEILLNDSHDCIKANKHLRHFYSAFKKAISFLDDEDEKLWGTKVFTDNIVLGSPIDRWWHLGNEEGVFGLIISGVIWFQIMMVQKGYFFRGGWSLGSLYMNDIVVYGKALIEAYNIESIVARYPRIVLSEQMKELVDKHMSYYSDRNFSPQASHILRDENSNYFVNYLFGPIEYGSDFSEITDFLTTHKKGIERNLKLYKHKPTILEKYRWIAYYHDYFCETFITGCPEDYFIRAPKEETWQINLL